MQHAYTWFFQSPTPIALHIYGPVFTDFPGLPSGASDAVIFPQQSETPVFPLGHPWLSAYLSMDFFPLSPSIILSHPFRLNRISNHSRSSPLCLFFPSSVWWSASILSHCVSLCFFVVLCFRCHSCCSCDVWHTVTTLQPQRLSAAVFARMLLLKHKALFNKLHVQTVPI